MMRITAVVVALVAISCGAVAAEREVLPAQVVPIRYDLALKPNATALTFSGEVGVTVQVSAPVRAITLNAEDLVFDQVRLDGGAPGRVTLDAKTGQATLAFDRPVSPGVHRLSIDYHGLIGRSTLGFFAMDYDTADGPRRTLATNFEPPAARRLLPCWDEPDRKAVFAVTIDAPADRTAVSNMPVEETTSLPGGLQRVSFAPTPKMASYLLYLGVGDFERIHQMVDGVDVGVMVKKGDAPKARYALEQASRLLHWYNGYFGTPYPLPKLDLIAAPGEIEGGSMENWGAIFYSQEHLLFDPARGAEGDRQLVFLVVAHEMAHQWFGDLVTMQWWDNLWLNEGFARWMQTYVADALHPEWRTGLQAQRIFEQGKTADARVSTHPVLQPVETVAQASQAFDEITYDKGAAVITMISDYVGPDRFRDGVRRYIRAHVYGNTADTDLWTEMQQVAGKPILQIEADFVHQAGLPLLRTAPAGQGLSIVEDRFHADPEQGKSRTAQRWTLPLTIAPAQGAPRSLLLRDEALSAVAPGALVNAGQTAYARTLYADTAFAPLLVRIPQLAAVDQLGLINDALALGFGGQAPASRALALIDRLPGDADVLVWGRAVGVLTALDDRRQPGPARDAFRRYARARLAPLAERLGRTARPGEDAAAGLVRPRLLAALGAFGDEGVVVWAEAAWADANAPAEARRAALDIIGRIADRARFDALLATAQAAADPLERQRIYEALAGTTDPSSVGKLIDLAMSGTMPTGVDIDVLAELGDHDADLAWTQAVPRLAESKAGISPEIQWLLAGSIAAGSSRPERIADLDAYVQKNVPTSARRPFLGFADQIRLNRRIADTVIPDVDRWIAARSTGP